MLLSVCAFALPSGWAVAEVESAKRAALVPEALLSDYQNAITREEFCTMAVVLYEKLSGKEAPAGTNAFTDTENADINSAFALKIVNGIGDGIFAPTALITREEIAAMFTRCIKAALPEISISDSLPNTYPDEAAVSDWAKESVKFVNMCEIMVGDTLGNINPKSNTTREQAILMTLRIYNAFKNESSFILGMYGFATSGNNASNMSGGAFAIKSLDGKLYIADKNGIFEAESKEKYTESPSLGMYVGSQNIYYIKATDNALYKLGLADKKETKVSGDAVSFSVAGEYIYIKNSKDELVALSLDTNKTEVLAKGITSVPMGVADGVYYSSSDGIYKAANGKTEEIYKGTATDTVNSNTLFYFKNEDGKVLSFNTESGKTKEITSVSVKKFCLYPGAVAYTTDDGLYKCSLDGKYNIKMLSDGAVSINSHEKDLFIKDSNGKIFDLNIYTGEKLPLN